MLFEEFHSNFNNWYCVVMSQYHHNDSSNVWFSFSSKCLGIANKTCPKSLYMVMESTYRHRCSRTLKKFFENCQWQKRRNYETSSRQSYYFSVKNAICTTKQLFGSKISRIVISVINMTLYLEHGTFIKHSIYALAWLERFKLCEFYQTKLTAYTDYVDDTASIKKKIFALCEHEAISNLI